jgi:hypothetical protein
MFHGAPNQARPIVRSARSEVRRKLVGAGRVGYTSLSAKRWPVGRERVRQRD